MSHFVITGAGGAAANRREINDLVKDEKQFSLYVQALSDIMSRDQPNIRSFFQVGGIHGLPFIPWDDSTGKNLDPAQWGGYCTHGSVLFPTWHRPYVMLYEQLLSESAKNFAAQYTTDAASWKAAATALRQPYWDWARNAVPPPEVISLQKVTITTPKGRVSVDNPLIRYKFHPIDPSFPAPYDGWSATLRQPNSTNPNATDNVARLRSVLQSAQRDITTKTYNLLTRVHTWPAFSNHTPGDGGSASNSLEAIHDGIHVDVGGAGQMSDPSVAAFDPIFFLHHTNVDRLLSLWSALNSNVWVTKSTQEDGTFTIPPDAPVDVNTPLTPFWNTQSTFWESSAVTGTSKLGYTYPEFNGLDMANPSAVKSAIAQQVNRLYGNAVFAGFSGLQSLAAAPQSSGKDVTRDLPSASAPAPAAAAPSQPGTSAQNTAQVHHTTDRSLLATTHSHNPHSNSDMWEWTARIRFKKYELGSSFSVLLFLGTVPENPEEWHTAETFVGAHHAFVNKAAEHCANCRNQAEVINEGFVHLNGAIAQHSGLNSFNPNVVKPYLTRELHWRVQKSDGTPAELESLEVTVVATPLSLPAGSDFPVPGETTHHHDITRGRRGGSRT